MNKSKYEYTQKDPTQLMPLDSASKISQCAERLRVSEQLAITFSKLRTEDSKTIMQAIEAGLLPYGSLEKAASHPANARGYLAFLSSNQPASLETIQHCVIVEFRKLLNMPIAARKILATEYTSTNQVQEGVLHSALTLGLISHIKHQKFGYFDEVLTAGHEHALLVAEINELMRFC